jgi:uncharacterized protein
MSRRTDVFDLGALALSSGEARRFDLEVETDPLTLGGESYQAAPSRLPVRLDVARTGSGYTLRLRFEAQLEGPCMRCLEPSGAAFEVDAREVHQEGRGEDPELRSPYVAGDDLDVRSFAREALVLALPSQVVCREDCRGICAECGESLNEDAEHTHERAPDPRWAKLSEIEFE